MELIAVAKDGVHIFDYNSANEADPLGAPKISFPAVPTADGCAWSSDGNYLGLFDGKTGGVRVLHAGDGYSEVCMVEPLVGGPVRSFYFSPLGNFLVTHERWVKDAGPNIGVWNCKTGESVMKFVLKQVTEMSWPPLKWTALETHCCRMVQDGVVILPGNLSKSEEEAGKLKAPGIMAFECAPRGAGAGPPHVAVVIAELKGAPARCQIFRLDDPSRPTATKNFFKAQTVKMWWNHVGSALLCKTSQEVDDTGKSYYGGSHLYFLRADGEESCIVAMPDQGPIHDVQWSPTTDEFFLLHGELPCRMTLHEGRKGSERMEFGRGHRNTIRWNPFGQFISCGGYGQLLGDTDFWDKRGKRLMGASRFETCVLSSWSPDGRQLLAATTAPRMRVDNKIVVYDYCGCRISQNPFEELLSASWRPRPRGTYQERPPSPEREAAKAKAKAKAGAGGYPGAAAQPKAQAYRPPGARAGGGSSFSALLRQELGSTSAQTSSTATRAGAAFQRTVPGADPVDAPGNKDNNRNARRKKAKENAQAAAAAAGDTKEEPAPKAPPTAAPEADASGPSGENNEVEKRIRALRKKLRDIAKLKELANPDKLQLQKIETEGDLLKQIEELGGEP
eukprot:CAMPEP_0206421924 /NCGR_PEP_ID=MMETSP0324_2-20121206/1744_1 /ASSEMBLY_ACC=CAM_ASM_000836 /TAXON_ID=2866 /ORGANISM="Crypthecodinium cohnii, Strain Seligo" /LENGTH=618 /DNA_ID=CAMNT_0053886125 /DNA_START=1 /DNA_END=1857 /DNA_ORIENTATION=-